jgi:hypothetical protein
MKLRDKLKRQPPEQEQAPAASPAQPTDELTAMNVELKKIMVMIVAAPDEMSIEEMRAILKQLIQFDQERLLPYISRVKELEGSRQAVFEKLEVKASHMPVVAETIRAGLAKNRLKKWERNGS